MEETAVERLALIIVTRRLERLTRVNLRVVLLMAMIVYKKKLDVLSVHRMELVLARINA